MVFQIGLFSQIPVQERQIDYNQEKYPFTYNVYFYMINYL